MPLSNGSCSPRSSASVFPNAGLYFRASPRLTDGTQNSPVYLFPNASCTHTFIRTRPLWTVGKQPPQLSGCSKYTTPFVERPTSRYVKAVVGERKLCCVRNG